MQSAHEIHVYFLEGIGKKNIEIKKILHKQTPKNAILMQFILFLLL